MFNPAQTSYQYPPFVDPPFSPHNSQTHATATQTKPSARMPIDPNTNTPPRAAQTQAQPRQQRRQRSSFSAQLTTHPARTSMTSIPNVASIAYYPSRATPTPGPGTPNGKQEPMASQRQGVLPPGGLAKGAARMRRGAVSLGRGGEMEHNHPGHRLGQTLRRPSISGAASLQYPYYLTPEDQSFSDEEPIRRAKETKGEFRIFDINMRSRGSVIKAPECPPPEWGLDVEIEMEIEKAKVERL